MGDRSGTAGGVKFQAKTALAAKAWVNEIRSLVKGGLCKCRILIRQSQSAYQFGLLTAGLPAIEVDDPDRSSMSNFARSYSEDYDARSVPDRSNMLEIRSQTQKTQTQSMEEMVQEMQGKYLRVLTRK